MTAMPSGTVTFLFTDIEGSTKLWEAHSESMRLSLARHDAVLREAIERHNGHLFKTVGDAFCVAFTTAPDAVRAALYCQMSLVTGSWPKETPIKVRMALHTGAVETRDNDYFGPPVNRVARLLAAGYGGQSLLSQTAYDLSRDSLPPGAEIRCLGEHRLKDLSRAETIFQLCHPDLPADFPPLRSLDNPDLKHNLPQQVTSFVGREKELAEVSTLLERARLLTLTGSGGTGKTRLALQAAADMLDGSGDGAWLVEFAAVADQALVPQTVADVLGIKEEAGKPIMQTLIDRINGRVMLVLLDNCEHLLEACAKLADSILRQCPRVLILATSREGLGISGEQTYRVPSLSLPNPKLRQSAASLSQYEAVRLFVDRALLARADFSVTNQNAPALASICHRLDGIPLAIELAAARIRSLSVEDINGKLDQRFRLLTGGSRTALPRHQTLRSMIDWSYDLLNETEKALLDRVSVFAGGWTLEAAEAVCSDEPIGSMQVAVERSERTASLLPDDVLDLLSSLCDKNLVAVEPSGSSVRYRLLETVRQYARDRMMDDGRGSTWRDRHLGYFMSLAEEAEPQLTGPRQQTWLERLETEHDNIRAALEWSGDANGSAGLGLHLAGALWRFWLIRGYLSEGRERLSRALDKDPRSDSSGRSKALHGMAVLSQKQGDYASARNLYLESLAIRRDLGDRVGIAAVIGNLGNMAFDQGDYAAVKPLYEECLAIFRELGERGSIAAVLQNLGHVAHYQGDYASARSLREESLAIYRELGNRQGIASSLNNLGSGAHFQGDYAAAVALQEESLTIFRELGDQGGIAYSLNNLGLAALDQGNNAAALSFFRESLAIKRDLGDRWGIAYSLEALAKLAATVGQPLQASQIWGAAEVLREAIGAPVPQHERSAYQQQVSSARTLHGDDNAFISAWAEGRAMSIDAAIASAMEVAVG